MEEENTEVLFESWGFKHVGTDKKRSLRITSSWKKQYFILFREDHVSKVCCYEKKPKNVKDKPKSVFELFPDYTLKKQFQYKEKPFVCVLANRDVELWAGFEEEKIFHLFCFFVQTQTHLREAYEGECFVVRPDNSDGHRKLGSRGNMCLLHVSQCGVILALQLSKCVLGQWPLKAIKWYESSGRQQFVFEGGRKSPMGGGIYVFNTRPEQDNVIYDKLDSFVMEAAGFKQFSQSSNMLSNENTDNISMSSQLLSLQSLTSVYSDGCFTATLKRISRDIYDHLSQHLGGSITSSSRPIGTLSGDQVTDGTFTRSKSANGSHRFTPNTPTTLQHSVPHSVRQISQPLSPITHPISSSSERHSPAVKPKTRPDRSLGPVPTGRPYENDFIEQEVLTARKIVEQNFSSSYLLMNSMTSQDQTLTSPVTNTVNRLDDNTTTTRELPEYSNFSHDEHLQQHHHNHPPPQGQGHSLKTKVPSSPKTIPKPHHVAGSQNTRPAYVLAKRVSDPRDSPTPVLSSSHPERQDAVIDSYSPVTAGDSSLLIERQKKRAISNEYTDQEVAYVEGGSRMPGPPLMRPRLQSQSLEDFSQYERMSSEDLAISNYLYHNEGFRMSDEVPSSPPVNKVTGDKHSPGIYSYTSPLALRTNAGAGTGALPPKSPADQQYNSIGDIGVLANSLGSPPLPALRKVDFLKMQDIYAKPLPRAVRKSRSISNLTDIIGREPIDLSSTCTSSTSRGNQGKVIFFDNNNTIKYYHSEQQDQQQQKQQQQQVPSPITVEPLAFANNMFKEELDTLKHGSPSKTGKTSEDGLLSSSVSPSRSNVKPKPMLSLFKREPSRESTSSSTTSGIRSMSTSPISPFPPTTMMVGVKSPGPGVKGIMFTPKTKSFKRPLGGDGSMSISNNGSVSTNTTDGNNRDSGGELAARRISGESVASSSAVPGGSNMSNHTVDHSLKRRTGSTSSTDKRMEGRRLPSLPPGAILNEDLDELGTAYAKVEETLC